MRYAIQCNSIILVTIFLLAAYVPAARSEEVAAFFMYNLSDFSGMIPFDAVRIFADRERREIFVIDSDNCVRIFNDAGMEIYRFNDDGSLGIIYDAVTNKQGDILVLAYAMSGPRKYSIIQCNYRGEPLRNLELKNVPREGFYPNALDYREGHLYLVDKGSMKVVVTDEQGIAEQQIDLLSVVGRKEKERHDMDISGFSVDREGDMFFTIPVMFKAYKLSHDGTLASFGLPGGSPGKFNVVSGIVADDKGFIYVADKLKCTIMIFDRDFKFLLQVGYRGNRAGNLIVPSDLAVLDDKLYVSQAAGRGVSVFGIRN